jgi:hypothetical protein
MAAAISDTECRALDRACADLICLLDAVSYFADVQGVAGQKLGQSQPPTHPPEHGGGRGPRRTANAQPQNQACTARIPAAERLDSLPALVELDLSSFAFHLEMGDDDNAAFSFLSTADHNGRGCQEMRSPQSTSMDSLFSQASTASSAWSVAVASRTASHPTPFGFDYRLDPDYCFDFRGPGSPRRSAFDGQTCAGATPFAYGSTPFDYVVVHGPNPLE